MSSAAFAAAGHAEEATNDDTLEFRTLLRARGGVVRCGLFRKEGWLKTPIASASARADAPSASCIFEHVPAGVYGLSAFHDRNDNGKLDTNFLGLPIEDYGASNDARGSFGPPSFEDAKFVYKGGVKRLTAQLK